MNIFYVSSGNWIFFLNNEKELFGALKNKEQIVA